MSLWNKSQLKDAKKRTRNEKNGAINKAKVAAAKASEIMTAMAEYHAAELAAMSAKISAVSFASGVPLRPPNGPPPTFQLTSEYGPSQYDLDEKARIALVKLQSILKPPSKKEKKAVP